MKTFIIIKPDAIQRGLIGKIISRFEDACFVIEHIQSKFKNRLWFSKMYGHLEGDIYVDMEKFMLSSLLIGVVLNAPSAVRRGRRMVGATNSTYAEPGTIRGDYGTCPIRFNCVHMSDSETAANQEIELFFGDDDGH